MKEGAGDTKAELCMCVSESINVSQYKIEEIRSQNLPRFSK